MISRSSLPHILLSSSAQADDPVFSCDGGYWMPAFAGMTGFFGAADE
jgi:hypothetical protein